MKIKNYSHDFKRQQNKGCLQHHRIYEDTTVFQATLENKTTQTAVTENNDISTRQMQTRRRLWLCYTPTGKMTIEMSTSLATIHSIS